MSCVRTCPATALALWAGVLAGCSFNGQGTRAHDRADASITDPEADAPQAMVDAPHMTSPDAPLPVDAAVVPDAAPEAPDAAPECESDDEGGILCIPFATIATGDDWKDIPEHHFDIKDGDGYTHADGYQDAGDGLTFRVAADDDFLYLLLAVKDDVVLEETPESGFNEDGVELYFEKTTGPVQIVLNVDGEGTVFDQQLQHLDWTDATGAILGDASLTLDGYQLEVILDREILELDGARNAAFDLSLIDDDSGGDRDALSSWYIGDSACPGDSCCAEEPQPYCDSTVLGTVIFEPAP